MSAGCGSLPISGSSYAVPGAALDGGGEQAGADQPVGPLGSLPECPLLDERAEDVGERLVKRPRLVRVVEARLILRDAVGQLVADHVDSLGEALEDLPVAVAVHHLSAVPEGVVVAPLVMDGGDERHAAVVDRVAAEDVVIEVVRSAGAVVGLVDRDVLARRVALTPRLRAGELRAVFGVVHGAVLALSLI